MRFYLASAFIALLALACAVLTALLITDFVGPDGDWWDALGAMVFSFWTVALLYILPRRRA